MNTELNFRLRQIIQDHLQFAPSKGAKAFGFYWTRKNAELASRLINEFSDPGSVILDPFLGSGSTALGSAASGENRLFIGLELNEMPLAFLKLSLGVGPQFPIEDTNTLSVELEEISKLYEFSLSAGLFRISKVIHRVEGKHLLPTSFVGDLVGTKAVLSIDIDEDLFCEIKDLYFERISRFEQGENSFLAPNSRIAVKPGMRISDLFGPIGFEALSRLRLLGRTNPLCQHLLGASIHLCRLTDAKSQSQFPYWYPKQNIHEKSVSAVLTKRLKEFSSHLTQVELFKRTELISEYQDWFAHQRNAMFLIQGDTTSQLKGALPDSCVDLVLTDPPYFDQVAYSEYLKLWEYFTGFESDLENEIVESSRVGGDKSRKRFLDDLSNAFKEVHRCMKNGAIALVYFKDSKPNNLHDFIFCLERAGLIYQSQTHLSKASFTYKQNTSQEHTVGGDSIMIFVAGEPRTTSEPKISETLLELDAKFLHLFGEYISANGPSSLTEALDNSLISHLYPSGYLSKIKSSSHFAELASRKYKYNSSTRKWSTK